MMKPTVYIMPLSVAAMARDSSPSVDWMDEKRRKRMDSYMHRSDADRMFGAEVLLRNYAAPLLGVLPHEVHIVNDEFGAPKILNSGLHASISHSRDSIAVMLSVHPCGVDIEQSTSVSEDVFDTVCPPDTPTLHSLRSTAEGRTTYWVSLEAALKMRGKGFLHDLKGYDISKTSSEQSRVTWGSGSIDVHISNYGSEIVGACCASGSAPDVHTVTSLDDYPTMEEAR